jgi:type II secretory pathway pseudopilin PulG
MPRITSRIALILVLALALIFGTWFAYGQWQKQRAAALQNKVIQGQADAAIKAGKIAVETVGNNADNAAAIDKTVREGTDAIDKATPGDSNDAALRESCKLRSFINTDRCRKLLQPADPVGVGGRRPDR